MASERSLFRKIQTCLDVTKSIDASSIADIKKEIKSLKSPMFYSRQYDEDADLFREDISEAVIEKTLRICQLLNLIRGNGSLSSEGREASRKTRFEHVISNQVHLFFQRQEVDIPTINGFIVKCLKSNPPVLPTVDEIWAATGKKISYGMFSRFMTLLTHCGSAKSNQRKIYLYIEPH